MIRHISPKTGETDFLTEECQVITSFLLIFLFERFDPHTEADSVAADLWLALCSEYF